MSDCATPTSLLLVGLRGDNPLAFLASVGTLRMLTHIWPSRSVKMSWQFRTGWQPLVHIDGPYTEIEVTESLHRALSGREIAPEFTLGYELEEAPKNLTIEPAIYAEIARNSAQSASVSSRAWADFCAAYGTDAFRAEAKIRDTDLRTMSGAGHQHFLEFMRKLAKEPTPTAVANRRRSNDAEDTGTSEAHLRSALFAPWTYADPGPAMRWDPLDDRRHALRADDPSNSTEAPIRTMRGANRLAIEALPCFPTAPSRRELLTCCFRNRVFSWPIWQFPITLDTLRSLLTHSEIVSETPRREVLAPIGVVEVFRSKRLTIGKLRNFTPAAPCWGFGETAALK